MDINKSLTPNSDELPEWQKALIDERLREYERNPDQVLDWDEVINELDEEDKQGQ